MSAGDTLLVVKRSHAWYWKPRMNTGSPTYHWEVWWGRWFVGRTR